MSRIGVNDSNWEIASVSAAAAAVGALLAVPILLFWAAAWRAYWSYRQDVGEKATAVFPAAAVAEASNAATIAAAAAVQAAAAATEMAVAAVPTTANIQAPVAPEKPEAPAASFQPTMTFTADVQQQSGPPPLSQRGRLNGPKGC